MNLYSLQQILNGNKFAVVGADQLHYSFLNDKLTISGLPVNTVHYQVYEEEGKFYLKTNPMIQTEDLRIDFKPNNSKVFTLSGKYSNKEFVILEKKLLPEYY